MVLKGPRSLAPLELMFSEDLGLSQRHVVPPLSGSGSGLLRVNWTFVGTPLGYLYLYPWAHSMMFRRLAPNFFWSWLYGIMSTSSRFPFKHWYSWSFLTPVAKMSPTSTLSNAWVISCSPRTCPTSATTVAAAWLTWSVVISPTQAARVSMALAAFCCVAATLARRP